MQTEKLYQILQGSTRVYRKGEAVERRQVGNVDVVPSLNGMTITGGRLNVNKGLEEAGTTRSSRL